MNRALPSPLPPELVHQFWLVGLLLAVIVVSGIGLSMFYARRRINEQNKLKVIEEARKRRRAKRQVQEVERQASMALAVRDAKGRRTKRRPVVLVVDDSQTVLNVARKALDAQEYRVVTAENGRDAWLVMQDDQPDLIVSDIEMPKVNGFQLLKMVREDMELSEVPVMLITSHLYYDVKMSQKAGANGFLAKPTGPDQMNVWADQLVEQVRYLLPD